MSAPPPSLREQGLQALREQNLDKAVDFLVRAVMSNDQDAEAQALLGIVYSQKNLHEQAKRAIQRACDIDPRNANFRFNLGIALERGGDLPGAALAYRDTIQLNPEHGQAKAKLQALGPQVHSLLANAPPASVPGGVPSPSAPPPPPTPSAIPTGGPPMSGIPMGGSPPGGGIPMGGPSPGGGIPMGGPSQGGGLGGLAPQAGPPGTIQCPKCGEWSKPGLTCEWCNSPFKAAPAAPPILPGAESRGYSGGGYVEDKFSTGDGFKDIFQVMTAPRAFFSDQVGQEGLKAPLSFLLALAFAFRIITFVADLALGLANGTRIASLGGAFCIWVFLMIGMFVWAGMVHLVTRMFNGQGGFGGSFRAVTYAQAPTMILGAIAYIFLASSVADMMKKPGGPGALSLAIYAPQVVVRPVQLAQAGPPGLPGGPPAGFPGGPGSSFPGGGMPGPGGRSPQEAQAILARLVGMFLLPLLIYSLGGIWTLVLTGMGVAHIHGTGNGATVGILFIANLVANVIATIIGFVLGGAIMAVLIPALQNMRR